MKIRFAILATILLSSVSLARAQGGCDVCQPCVNSPECPTAVLAAVGVAGVGLAKRFTARRR